MDQLDQQDLFTNFIAESTSRISLLEFFLNLAFASLSAFILTRIYQKYGTSLSNRKSFSENFVLLTLTTMLIITIVKSSLALSLGLVGALSIVRFRTALKEPEELIYAFICIALGLGFGANQSSVTFTGFLFIIFYIAFRSKFIKKYKPEYLNLVLSSSNPQKDNIDEIIDLIKIHCKSIKFKRLNQEKDFVESSFSFEIRDYAELLKIKKLIIDKSDTISFSFIDTSSIPNL